MRVGLFKASYALKTPMDKAFATHPRRMRTFFYNLIVTIVAPNPYSWNEAS